MTCNVRSRFIISLIRRAILRLTIVLVVTSAVAESPLSIERAVNYALKNNPDLHVYQEQVMAAHEQYLSVNAASQPVISISYSARVSDNPLDAFANKLYTRQITTQDFIPEKLNNPDTSELYVTSLSLRWPIYSGGKIEAQQMQKNVQHQQSQMTYQRAKQLTVFHTKQAYLYVIASHKAMKITEQATDAYQKHANSTAKLAKQERIVESDKLSAQVNLSAIKSQLEQSKTRYKNAITRLKHILGMKVNRAINVELHWPTVDETQENIDELYNFALKNRVDLLAALKAIESARANIDVANATNNPKVDFVASSNWYDENLGFDSQSSSLMAVASFNLYDGTRNGKVGAARAQHKEQQWRLESLKQKVRSEVKQAHDGLLEAKSRVAIAKNNVILAKKTVGLVKKRYGRGRTILLDLLQSERMYIDARLEKLTSEFNLKISQLTLLSAVGLLEIPKENQH